MSNRTPRIDRVLMGDNPFIGVDHLSRERARDRMNRLDTNRIAEIIRVALDSGAQGISFSAHQKMYDVLALMKSDGYAQPFGMYPLIPYAQEYVRLANEKGMVGLAKEIFGRLSWSGRAKTLVGGGLSLVSFDPVRVLKTYVDAEMNILMKHSPPSGVLKSIILHETITDLVTSFQATGLVDSYVNHVESEFRVKPGFATRNFARFVGFMEASGIELGRIVVLTPFNKLGFQMNPSREACEHALNGIKQDVNVIAMSILASGYLSLTEAMEYLKTLPKIGSYVVGVSTLAHARQTFSQMRETALVPAHA